MINQNLFPKPVITKSDRAAKAFIIIISIIVFAAIALLSRVQLKIQLPFNPHVFAGFNAMVNSIVALLLLAALWSIRQKNYQRHKRIMLIAILLSILFLLSYIAHHLLAGETKFGDLDHNGIVSDAEKGLVGNVRIIYFILLLTHIPLAAIILPFILFTAYRALSGDYERHKKLARITWPIWFYVAVSGVVIYLMIQPYYN